MDPKRISLTLLLALALPAAAAGAEAPLPPEPAWEGESLSLALDPGDPWATPAEASGLRRSPSYDETVAWLRRLEQAAPQISLVTLGRSHEGRELWMAVASREGAATPEALRASGRPTLLVQAGIHSGEIDGKDAGLMLLRDMTVGGRLGGLLEGANLLFLPIFNADGHERSSPQGRLNQRGPEEQGWRTNARNLNLNRDYAKLDTPEMRALVAALNRWDPQLYVDVHVTDGIDYQYDVTLGYNGPHAYSPSIAGWIESRLLPAAEGDLRAMGHVPGPLIFAVDRSDPSRGIGGWTAGPRFSNGYGDLRHLPTLLVENHSLKSFGRRVLGTRVLLESLLRLLAAEEESLREAIRTDRARRPVSLPLRWRVPEGEPETMEFLGIEWRRSPSAVSGGTRIEWTGRPVTLRVPRFLASEPELSVSRPPAYLVPPTHPEVIERLRVHGIRLEELAEARTLAVEMYRLEEPELAGSAYEGHVRVEGRPVPERRSERFPPGTVRVPTDQPLGDLAMALLEPASPDSFFQWGFFLECLQRTEYGEGYVLEPLAEDLLASDPELRAAFEKRLAEDPGFAADPRARLDWFYLRSPWSDERWRLYPVAREIAAPASGAGEAP
jgi:murein tripeptide amidase MpaA